MTKTRWTFVTDDGKVPTRGGSVSWTYDRAEAESWGVGHVVDADLLNEFWKLWVQEPDWPEMLAKGAGMDAMMGSCE